MTLSDERDFVKKIAAEVQKVMPWPYTDVERDSQEARECAESIAKAMVEVAKKEWTP